MESWMASSQGGCSPLHPPFYIAHWLCVHIKQTNSESYQLFLFTCCFPFMYNLSACIFERPALQQPVCLHSPPYSPSLTVRQHVVTRLPLHSGLCVYALPASSALLRGCLERTSTPLAVTEVSECSEPSWRHAAATPQTHQQAGRRTGRHTNRGAGWVYL